MIDLIIFGLIATMPGYYYDTNMELQQFELEIHNGWEEDRWFSDMIHPKTTGFTSSYGKIYVDISRQFTDRCGYSIITHEIMYLKYDHLHPDDNWHIDNLSPRYMELEKYCPE